MTLLAIVQNAQDLISGMPRCSSVIGNTDPQVRQLLALANEAGRTLIDVHPWAVLTKKHTFTTVAAELQPGFLPADFHRFVDETMWNTSRRMRVNGPMTSKEYSEMKAMVTSPSVAWFARRGGWSDFIIYPAPSAGETISYDYISAAYAKSNLGIDQMSFQADTDISPFTRLISLGLVWMWLSRKGLDFSTELSTYQLALQRMIAADGGRRRLDATGSAGGYVQPPSTPEGSWSL